MDYIRVLVIDDSAFMRKMISDLLSTNQRIKVIGTARNGEDGLKKVKALSPDIVTLDVEMPIMDGISTLKKIMEENPLPVVMLSSVTSKGATKTIQAISLGAVDFITKPSGSISLDINLIKEEMIKKVLTASSAKIKKIGKIKKVETNKLSKQRPQTYQNSIIFMGTSTGGPRALQQVLTDLPSDFPAPILIVQHMPPNFTKSLADRLNSMAKIHIKEASHGEIVQKGTAYIAPGDYHMHIRRVGTSLAIELTKEKPVGGHRPCVDILFQSGVKLTNINKVAVVLTGMGRDGANGITELKKTDPESIVIAEAEESSVVYGMPQAAVKTGYVNQVSDLRNIGNIIVDIVKKTRG